MAPRSSMANNKPRIHAPRAMAATHPARVRTWRDVFAARSDQSEGGVRLDAGSDLEDSPPEKTAESQDPGKSKDLQPVKSDTESETDSDDSDDDADTLQVTGHFNNDTVNCSSSSSSGAGDINLVERLEKMCQPDSPLSTDSSWSRCFEPAEVQQKQAPGVFGSPNKLQFCPDGSIVNTETGEVYTRSEHTSPAKAYPQTPVNVSPVRKAPVGYRGGLTGSVSDGTLQMISSPPSATLGMPMHERIGVNKMDMGKTWVPLSGAVLSSPSKSVVESSSIVKMSNMNETTSIRGSPKATESMLVDDSTLPFVELARFRDPRSGESARFNVVHLTNIPFSASRAEVIAFFGRNSRIANDDLEPVHIIMDRVSSKTNDAYVEFCTDKDAAEAVEKLEKVAERGRPARIGARPIYAQVVSHERLMRDLFPVARGVDWSGPRPVILPQHDGQFAWEKFKTFITAEEMTMMVKHVETPSRSPYAKDCPERPFECLISTITKMPWCMTEHITIYQRHTVFEACIKLLDLLKKAILQRYKKHEDRITQQLFERLVKAAMRCPGFTVVQKDDIAFVAGLDAEQLAAFHQPLFADHWRHQYALGPRPGASPSQIDQYVAVIRDGSQQQVEKLNLNPEQKAQVVAATSQTSNYWGLFWFLVGYHQVQDSDFDNMTLAEAAEREWSVVKQCVAGALTRQLGDGQDNAL